MSDRDWRPGNPVWEDLREEYTKYFEKNTPIRIIPIKHGTVPLMYYGDNLEGRQIGTAVIKDGSISVVITDQDLSDKIQGDVLKHLSLGFDVKSPKDD